MLHPSRIARLFPIVLFTTLSANEQAMPSDQRAGALMDTAAASSRKLSDTKLEFVVTEKAAGDSESHTHGYSQCTVRRYLFAGKGFRAESRSLDPIVTPAQQLEFGTLLLGGQALDVFFDGEIELQHEDLPETEEDAIDIAPTMQYLGTEDPRRFGLLGTIQGSWDTIVANDDGTFAVRAGDHTVARVTTDANDGMVRGIDVYSCDNTLLATWTFSGFRWIDAGEGPVLYPRRSELRQFDAKGSGATIYDVAYVLRDAHPEFGHDIAAELRSHPITAASIVGDDRYVPRARYFAVSGRVGPTVTFDQLGGNLLDHLQGESHAVSEAAKPDVTPPTEPSSTAEVDKKETTAQASAAVPPILGVLVATVALLMWRRDRRIAVLFLIAGGVGVANASETKTNSSDGVRATPQSVRWERLQAHETAQSTLEVANTTPTSLTLSVECDSLFVTTWPRQILLAPHGAAQVEIDVTAPAGALTLDALIEFRTAGGELALTVPVHAELPSRHPAAPEPASNQAPTVIPSDRPILFTETASQDLGRIVDTESVNLTYPIENRGNTPLEIGNIHAECGCSQASIDSNTLLPGESTLLRVVFSPEGRSGIVRRNIFVATNDPSTPNTTFTFQADVLPEITFSPDQFDLGTISPGASEELLVDLGFAQSAHAIKKVSAHGFRLIDDAYMAEGEHAGLLSVMIEASVQEGPVQGELQIEFVDRLRPVRLRINALIRDTIYAEPHQLDFAYIDAARISSYHAEFSVLGAGHTEPTSLEFDRELLRVDRVAATPDAPIHYRVSIVENVPAGFFASNIQLVVKGRQHPIVVPVRGIVAVATTPAVSER